MPSLAGKLVKLAGVKGSLKVSKIPLVPSLATSTAAASAHTLRKTASQTKIVIRRDSPSGDEADRPPTRRIVETSGPKVRFDEAEGDQEQMPTPPNSQSPPRKKTTAAGKGKGKAEVRSCGPCFPFPARSLTASRSSSRRLRVKSRSLVHQANLLPPPPLAAPRARPSLPVLLTLLKFLRLAADPPSRLSLQL